MRFETTDGKSSTPEGQKIQPLDLTKSKSQELKKQQSLLAPENDAASRKLDSISPPTRQIYEWLLRQKDPSLAGKALEKAIWKLHKDRQEKDSNPEKTAVAPDKSDTQTLADQISRWSSSDTLVSPTLDAVQTNMLPDHTNQDIEKQLREGLRNIAREYRQQGISRSTAPDLKNMTERQFLLEVLSKPDWSNRLQERDIEVNGQILLLIGQKLKLIDSSNLPDYNTAVRHFHETVKPWLRDIQKGNLKVNEHLLVEPTGLRGGAFYRYDRDSQVYYGLKMTLIDPEGKLHTFNKGQQVSRIVTSIDLCIKSYKEQHAAQHSESEYNKGEALTIQQVKSLKKGASINGWKCTEFERFPLQKKVYYTDMGTEIHALDLSSFESYSKEEHNEAFPHHPPLEDPTPKYNCHSIFINKEAWLLQEAEELWKKDCDDYELMEKYMDMKIQCILTENKYNPISNELAQIGDIVTYRQFNGCISHTAIVTRIDDPSRIIVESKPGDYGLIQHDICDARICQEYGEPTIYHTNRKGGHTLLRASGEILRTPSPTSSELSTPPSGEISRTPSPMSSEYDHEQSTSLPYEGAEQPQGSGPKFEFPGSRGQELNFSISEIQDPEVRQQSQKAILKASIAEMRENSRRRREQSE